MHVDACGFAVMISTHTCIKFVTPIQEKEASWTHLRAKILCADAAESHNRMYSWTERMDVRIQAAC